MHYEVLVNVLTLAVNTTTGNIKGKDNRITLKAMPTKYAILAKSFTSSTRTSCTA